MHVSLALMMGMLLTGGDNDHAPLRKQTSVLNVPTSASPIGDDTGLTTAAPVTMWSQTEPAPTATYYLEGSEPADAGHAHYGGGYCADCDAGCRAFGCRHIARLLHIFPSPGDMPMHIPYIAEPKNYYYFRPYNWFHIPEQQREVMMHTPPGDPRNPYDTRFMQDIYLQMEEKYGDLEILPGRAADNGSSPNDILPPPNNGSGLLPLQTYGNRNLGDFEAPAIFPASTSRRVGR